MGPALAELEGDPTAAHAELRASGPVAWVASLGAWLVVGRAAALEVMRDAATYTVDDERFTTARVLGASMLSTDGDEHGRHRAPFARRFRRRAVLDGLSAGVAAETDRLLDALLREGARRGELRDAFAAPLSARVAADALGLSGLGTDEVLGHYEAIVAAVTDATAGRPLRREGLDAAAGLRAAMGPGVADPGDLTDEEARANAAVLLFGGIETTEGMLLNALAHLLAEPEALARARADRTVLQAAVEESLRLEPSAATVDRYATRDVELAGSPIRRGDLVTVSLRAANRDPEIFPDPDRFDVDRPNSRLHLAFAAGPHVCLGMHLARLEAHTALGALLVRLPGLAVDARADRPDPVGLVFRRPRALHVTWEREGTDG